MPMISKIRIIAIGRIKERYLLEGINEYLKRLSRFCKIEIIKLKDEGIKKDSEKISRYSNAFVLDAKGKQFSSEEFADFLKKNEGELSFIIGGPEGISEEIKKKSKLLSLSRMTFLHEMSRLILLEQIYRGYTIINNIPYHK
jgi:23S rRNA (pseudouridine1915-N3)-methyltransferase